MPEGGVNHTFASYACLSAKNALLSYNSVRFATLNHGRVQ